MSKSAVKKSPKTSRASSLVGWVIVLLVAVVAALRAPQRDAYLAALHTMLADGTAAGDTTIGLVAIGVPLVALLTWCFRGTK